MKTAVFLPNWIGDTVMATPTLRALRKKLGRGAVLVGIMKPYVGGVLDGTRFLDEQWYCDLSAGLLSAGALRLVRRLHAGRFDLAVLLTNSRPSAVAAWMGGVRERAGYVRYRRGPFLTIKLHPPRRSGMLTPVSTLDYYLRLAYALGCDPEPPTMDLATTARDEEAADALWQAMGLQAGGRVIVVNSGGAFGGGKLWPDTHFAELARRIAAELGHDVLVLCGPRERARAVRISRLARHPRVMDPGSAPLSIGLSKAVVRRSRLMITTDSGPRHFAAAFRVPVIALFGPTAAEWSDTHYAGEHRIRRDVDCGPCQQPVCPLGHHRCMRDLEVERVYSQVLEALGSQGRAGGGIQGCPA